MKLIFIYSSSNISSILNFFSLTFRIHALFQAINATFFVDNYEGKNLNKKYNIYYDLILHLILKNLLNKLKWNKMGVYLIKKFLIQIISI